MGVEIIFRIAAVGLLSALICMLLKKSNREELATLTTIASLIIVLVMVMDMVVQLFDTIRNLFEF